MNSNKYPRVSHEDYIGSKGMRIVQEITEEELGWLFRAQTTRDFGIDAHLEVVDDNRNATGKLIATQIKCGKSFFLKSNDQGYIFRPVSKHIRYWLHHSLPVVLIACNPDTRCCWWTEVTEGNVLCTGKGWKIILPFGNTFEAGYKHVLSRIAGQTLTERIKQRYRNRLLRAPVVSDTDFFEIIHRGGLLMGFRRVSEHDYRALVFSQDYIVYQSDSFYDINEWKAILELSGLDNCEINEALEKADHEIL